MLCGSAWASEGPASIEVFAGSTFQEINSMKHATVYRLDRIDELQKALSQQLPGDPEKAKQLALRRFQRMDAQLSHQLENATKGLVQALQYGINRYPAIVFDGHAVIYGITDIETAARLYDHWVEQNR
ncbi:MAG: TIGR03757 family integrating conjugative element protein [Gammaproteobacteria bacterium]|jgi:integrating conjugative element protein (TIGR03757 family)|nr:TIGR03757 family integrating conjugative element protein [Gammaproteobacteria bacterium]